MGGVGFKDLIIHNIEKDESNYNITASEDLITVLKSYHSDVEKSTIDSFTIYLDETPKIRINDRLWGEIPIACRGNYQQFIKFCKGGAHIRNIEEPKNKNDLIFVSYYSYKVIWDIESFQLIRQAQ